MFRSKLLYILDAKEFHNLAILSRNYLDNT